MVSGSTPNVLARRLRNDYRFSVMPAAICAAEATDSSWSDPRKIISCVAMAMGLIPF